MLAVQSWPPMRSTRPTVEVNHHLRTALGNPSGAVAAGINRPLSSLHHGKRLRQVVRFRAALLLRVARLQAALLQVAHPRAVGCRAVLHRLRAVHLQAAPHQAPHQAAPHQAVLHRAAPRQAVLLRAVLEDSSLQAVAFSSLQAVVDSSLRAVEGTNEVSRSSFMELCA